LTARHERHRWPKKTAGLIKIEPSLGSVWNLAVVGFRISQYHRQYVGWVECNETQRSLDQAQPNLQNWLEGSQSDQRENLKRKSEYRISNRRISNVEGRYAVVFT
jgi:hypothetical protein